MIKRIAALTLALILLAGMALAEGTAQYVITLHYDNLMDKLMRQLQESSVRCVFKLTVEGDSDLAQQLKPLSGAMITVRMQNEYLEKGLTRSEMILYAEKDGVRTANTRLWSDGVNLYATSDMLIDTILRYPWKGDILSSVASVDQSNPNYLTAVAKALIHGLDWEQDAAPLRSHVESWVGKYAGEPQRVSENGVSLLRFAYEIPEGDIKAEIKALLRVALTDKGLYNLVKFYLTDAQKQTAFSEVNLAYEDWMIDSFPMGGPIRIVRDVSTMGELRRLQVVYPLGEDTALTWEQADGTDSFTLRKGEAEYGFTIRQTKTQKDNQAWEGSFTLPQDGQQIRGTYVLTRKHSDSTDSELVKHEYTIWAMDLTPAKDSPVRFTPINAAFNTHFYSNYDQQSKTTLDCELNLTQGTTRLKLQGKLSTRDRWDVEDMDGTGAIDMTAVSPEERREIYGDFLTNAMVTLSFLGKQTAEATVPAGSEEAPAEEPEAQETGSEESMPGLMPVETNDAVESEEDVL